MYKLLLISKYLRRKLAPLFAAVAVTICTAMVIIVASVMGGFLELMQTTAKQLTPEVVIETPSLTGFAGYEELIERLEARPEVELATPAIEGLATITIERNTNPVQVVGIVPSEYSQIVPYNETLLWTGADMADAWPGSIPASEREGFEQAYDLDAAGRTLTTPQGYDQFGMRPGGAAAVIGVVVNPGQRRQADGSYIFPNSITNLPMRAAYELEDGERITALDSMGNPVRPPNPIRLSLPVFSPSGEPIDAEQLDLPVVNEFQTGYFELDTSVVFVPFDWLQRAQKMHAMTEWPEGSFDPETGLNTGEPITRPGRATHVYVKAAVNPDTGEPYRDRELQAICGEVVTQFLNDNPTPTGLKVMTWEDVHGTLLGAVKNEKGLVTFLFAIISVVAIVMVATTFYMIVLEKTRDIGVLRAIGAPSTGVLGLFLGYGLAIGIIGTGAGVWLAWFTVTNLNNLQEALATRLGTLIGTVSLSLVFALLGAVLVAYINRKRDFSLFAGSLLFLGVFVTLMVVSFYSFQGISLPFFTGLDEKIGWRMWDPQLYFFEKIPDQVAWNEVRNIAIGAVLSSVLGAIIPAVIAARLNPVEALRYE